MKDLVFILFVAISMISLVSIVTASAYDLELSQVENKIVVKHSISLDKEQTLSIDIPSDASSISSSHDYSIQDNQAIIQGKDINLSYVTQSSLEKSEDGYFFIDTIKMYSDFNQSRISLVLDEGYFIDSSRVFPKPSSTITDGRQITLEWDRANVKEGEDIPLFVSIQTTPSIILIVLYWTAVFAFIIFAGYWLYARIKRSKPLKHAGRHKRKSTKAEKIEDIERYLMESEKAVLNALKQSDRGEAWQKQIQLATGFSKAKLSRVIRNLESRNLVEKIPFGNTNKVRLK